MEHLPVFINLRQKPCLVVGGGDIALRKVNLLLKAQAKIKCISPKFCSGLIDLSKENTLRKTKMARVIKQFNHDVYVVINSY